ncbi:trypco2 family protein [Streptomyces arboris]|uniref:trypco2 family protein n=1 Tax=Streptomyces arboris TaxID=2600619 RepID=UPI003C2DD33C
MENEASDGFGLDEVIRQVSQDLLAAQQHASEGGNGFGLKISTVEIELIVALTRESKVSGRAGLKVQVLPWLGGAEVAGDASRTSGQSRTHRIKLNLWSENENDVGA